MSKLRNIKDLDQLEHYKDMDLALLYNKMEQCIKAIGGRVNNTGKDDSSVKISLTMKVIGRMVNKKVKESLCGEKENKYLKEILLTGFQLEKEYIHGQMEISTLEKQRKARSKGLENSLKKMDMSMLENGMMISSMEREFKNTLMEMFMKVNLRTVDETVMELSLGKMEANMLESGKTEEKKEKEF